jgi:hypothetical protein
MCQGSDKPTFDGGDDLAGIGGPDERLWFVFGLLDEGIDDGQEVDDRPEGGALQAGAWSGALPSVGPLRGVPGVAPGKAPFDLALD